MIHNHDIEGIKSFSEYFSEEVIENKLQKEIS